MVLLEQIWRYLNRRRDGKRPVFVFFYSPAVVDWATRAARTFDPPAPVAVPKGQRGPAEHGVGVALEVARRRVVRIEWPLVGSVGSVGSVGLGRWRRVTRTVCRGWCAAGASRRCSGEPLVFATRVLG